MSLTVNANGNTTARGADAFTFDQPNRLKTAIVAGSPETYIYDGDGVRFSRQVGAASPIRSVSDINRSRPVTIDDGTRKYVYGLGLAYAVAGSTIEVYHPDRLGSTRAITDAAGTVSATYRTDEWGVPTTTTGSSSQPFRFTGEPQDATGLTYLRARYYDPTLGRLITRDGWFGVPTAPNTLNRYAYAFSNPTTLTDPSGMSPSSQVLEPRPVAGPNPEGIVQDPYAWAKGGKQNIRDSGLIGVSPEEIKRLARDKSLSPQERARYIREEKALGLRNKEKRSNIELSDPWGEILVGGGTVIAGVASAWWAAKALAPAFGPLAPVWLIVG